jgi:hypothetical protein
MGKEIIESSVQTTHNIRFKKQVLAVLVSKDTVARFARYGMNGSKQFMYSFLSENY